MKFKADTFTESMFAQAVALSQNGKMKSTIHCGGNSIYILNMDNTILLKMKCNQKFPQPFSFFGNDYESPNMLIENGTIAFETASGDLSRKKTCSVPKANFAYVEKLWAGFVPEKAMKAVFTSKMTPLLEDGLSHIEVSKKANSGVLLLQRDIYTGSRVEIRENAAMKSLLSEGDDAEFGPVGIRTNDFTALFSFVDTLNWYFQKDKSWAFFEDNEGIIQGILAQCLYDELGDINIIHKEA